MHLMYHLLRDNSLTHISQVLFFRLQSQTNDTEWKQIQFFLILVSEGNSLFDLQIICNKNWQSFSVIKDLFLYKYVLPAPFFTVHLKLNGNCLLLLTEPSLWILLLENFQRLRHPSSVLMKVNAWIIRCFPHADCKCFSGHIEKACVKRNRALIYPNMMWQNLLP